MQFKVIVIGGSLGGASALHKLLPALPADLQAAVVVVLHRSSDIGGTYVKYLQKCSALPLSEPEDKEQLQTGRVYLAPADFHLLINDGYFSLSVDKPALYARPSIDLLFESAADDCGSRIIAVLLTGASGDGARGMAAIKNNGGFTIAQDPKEAECPTMPQAAIDAHAVDYIMTLEELAPFLAKLCGGLP